MRSPTLSQKKEHILCHIKSNLIDSKTSELLKSKDKSLSKNFYLKRTKQCETCPWRKEANPFDIPGYDPEKHLALMTTISRGLEFSSTINIMACHYSEEGNEDYCVGWLVNQIGVGNNISLRIKMLNCINAEDIEAFGEQHQKFKDTLPKKMKKTDN